MSHSAVRVVPYCSILNVNYFAVFFKVTLVFVCFFADLIFLFFLKYMVVLILQQQSVKTVQGAVLSVKQRYPIQEVTLELQNNAFKRLIRYQNITAACQMS